MGRQVAASQLLPMPYFALIIDVDRLPEWNGAIERVIERRHPSWPQEPNG